MNDREKEIADLLLKDIVDIGYNARINAVNAYAAFMAAVATRVNADAIVEKGKAK